MDSFSAKKPRRLRQNIQQGRTDSFAFCHDGTKLRCCRRLAGGKQQSAGLLQSFSRRIRSPAGEPRPGKQSTGLFAWTGLSNPSSKYPNAEKDQSERIGLFLVGEDGFEPSKRNAADLQSVPFGHSGTPPYVVAGFGAGRRTRTPDLLITNQLLYQLSYTGGSNRTRLL